MGSSRRGNSLLSRKPGCPVPLSGGCLKGLPLPQSMEDGVKMICSNAKCQFQNDLMHLECFQALEDNLVKMMSNIGSARGWTDAQRRSNLWDKKGLTLIQKKCRCPCGLGLMRLDDAAMFEARLSSEVNRPKENKGRKGKHKNLPKLNFGSGTTCASSTHFDKLSKRENKRIRNPQSLPESALDGFSTNNASAKNKNFTLEDRSCSMRRRPITYSMLLNDWDTEYLTDKVVSSGHGWTKQRSAVPTSVCGVSSVTCLPSFSTRPNDRALTYAAATSLPQQTRMEYALDIPVQSAPLSTSSCNNSSHFLYNEACFSNKNNPGMNISVGFASRGEYSNGLPVGVDLSLILPSPPATPSAASSIIEETQNKDGLAMQDDISDDSPLFYELFHGPSFQLGEKLIAEHYLPGIFR